MRNRGRVIAFAAGALLVAEGRTAGAQPGGASGIALDARTRQPVADVRVEVLHTSAIVVSDAGGHFVIAGIPPGPRVMRATAGGYAILTRSIDIRPGVVEAIELSLVPTTLRLHEAVVVTARRDETSSFDAPRSTTILTAAMLAERMPRTTPEALMEATGVWVQKTNHGGGSPFVRGLVGNQILVLVDGIRLNNSTFRLGPNQYVSTVAPGPIESIEVVRGSGSVLYGSDALGGVVHILTKRPQFSFDGPEWNVTLFPKMIAAGMEQGGRIEAQARGARAAVIGGLSVRRFGDLRAGGDLGVESPSGYDELDGDVKAIFRPSAGSLLTVAYQHVHQSDVPRFDQVAQRGFARYAFDPQIRRLGYARFQMFPRTRWLQALTATASLHQSSERRVRQQRGSSVRITEQDDVDVIGLSVETKTALSPAWSFVSGVDYYHDAIGSWRRDHDTAAGAIRERRGLYPDGALANSAAAFGHSALALGRLTIEGGARYTRYAVHAEDERFGRTEIERGSWVASGGAAYALAGAFKIFASLAQGFRAPNLDDLSTLGAFDFGVEVPAPGLSPERALSYEAGLKAKASTVSASAAIFRTDLRDLIDRVRSSFDGSPIFEGQPVYQRMNVGRAYVQGFEGDVEWQMTADVSAFGNFTYTFGHQTTTDQPVRRIPPANGLLGARWQPSDRFSTETVFRYALRQDRLAPGDRDDHRIAPGGTPSWKVLEIRARGTIGRHLDVTGGVQNIFDEAYRVHGSGIDGPGRSLWAGTTIRF